MSREAKPWFELLFGACAVLVVLPLWLSPFPPLVDLAQHGAQIAIWSHWGDADAGYDSIYRINWLVPHVLPHTLVYLLSFVVSIPVALQIVLSASLVTFPLAALWLVRLVGGERWCVFALFPVGYGFGFYWGFFNFVAALPVALVVVGAAWRYVRRPKVGRGVALFVLSQCLFLCHVLLFAYTMTVAALWILLAVFQRSDDALELERPLSKVRRLLRLATPMALSVPLPLAWFFTHATGREENTIPVLTFFALGWRRFVELPGLILGDGFDGLAVVWVLAVLLLLVFLGLRPARGMTRHVPLAVALAVYFLGPLSFMGTSLVSPRHSVLVLPALLFAAEVRDAHRSRLRLLVPALAAIWLLLLAVRFLGAREELGDLRSVLARAEPHKRLLYLAFDHGSEHLPYPVFMHIGSWYQVERRGVSDFSFSTFFAHRFRYRPETRDSLYRGFEGTPDRFYWSRDGGDRYDYFLVRSLEDSDKRFFERAGGEVEEVLRAPPYWLYRRVTE